MHRRWKNECDAETAEKPGARPYVCRVTTAGAQVERGCDKMWMESLKLQISVCLDWDMVRRGETRERDGETRTESRVESKERGVKGDQVR